MKMTYNQKGQSYLSTAFTGGSHHPN